MRRAEVWLLNLDPTIGAEIQKTRPVVIVSDDAIGILPLSDATMRDISRALMAVLAIET